MRYLRAAGRILFGGEAARRQTAYRAKAKLQGIDLEGATADQLGLDAAHCNDYADSGYLVRPIFRRIGGGHAVLDIGCGKGGAMLALLDHFYRVDGVDLSERLVRVARQNLRRYTARAQVFHGDATQFARYSAYDTFYLFNPFPAEVLRSVVERILFVNSTARLIYVNPRCADVLRSMGYRETARVDASHPVSVYQFDAEAAASTA